jgi:hypothetical protein
MSKTNNMRKMINLMEVATGANPYTPAGVQEDDGGDAARPEQIIAAWAEKYSGYIGGNNDELPAGIMQAMLSSGSMSDGWVDGEEYHPVTREAWNEIADIFGGKFGEEEAQIVADVIGWGEI